jgi:hypothetical protein
VRIYRVAKSLVNVVHGIQPFNREAIKKLIKQMNCNKNVLLIFIANTLAYLIVIQEELLGTINMGDYT